MTLLKKIKIINNSIKKSIQNSRKNLNQKLESMEKISELQRVKSEKQCKQMYLKIIADKHKQEQLYKNIEIEFQYFEGNITNSEYKIQMKKHTQKIDELLSSLNYDNLTCKDLYSLYGVK